MRVYKETYLAEFNAWCGGAHTQSVIINAGKEEQFDELIDDWYPDGLSETELNDLLWFDDELLFKELGIKQEEED